MKTTEDIYDGKYVCIWHDGKIAFVTIFPNAVTFSLPLGYLSGLFVEFAKAQAAYQSSWLLNGMGQGLEVAVEN